MATAALRTHQRARFSTIHSERNLLPIDLLQRIEQLDAALPGLTARDYHVDGYKINEEINDAWLRALDQLREGSLSPRTSTGRCCAWSIG